MTFVPVVDAAQISLVFSQQDGSFAENVMWAQHTGAITESDLLSIADAYYSWWNDGDGTHSYKGLMSHDCELVDVIARDMTTEFGGVVHADNSLPVIGGTAELAFTMGLTFSITARSGLAGRSFRGRTFLIGMPTTAAADAELNTISGTYAADMVSAFNAMVTSVPIGDAGFVPVICSRVTLGAPRVAGVTTPITSFGFHNLIVDFQRRRAPAHNRHH